MGIPIQTPMGATGGAGIFTAIDNSAEFGTIAAELATISANLTTMISLNQSTYWGSSALLVPGSPAASLANISSSLADIKELLIVMKDKQVDLQGSLNALTNAVQAQTQVHTNVQSLTAMMVADQIRINDFTMKETMASLRRNDIEPQPIANPIDLLKSTLQTSTSFSVSTDFLTSFNNLTTTAINVTKNYITNSAPYIWGQQTLEKLWQGLGLNRLTEALANPAGKVKQTAAEARAVQARLGTWTPTA